MPTNENLLGTVIFDFDNPLQQSLILMDLKNSYTQEFEIKEAKSITYKDSVIPLRKILLETNADHLEWAHEYKENTSFILNQDELKKMREIGLINSVNQ